VLRLRAIRFQRCISLPALKAATGMAVSNLQKLEADNCDPQLSSPQASKELSVTVGELIAESQPRKEVKIHERKGPRTKR
jgi:hypothetical protein